MSISAKVIQEKFAEKRFPSSSYINVTLSSMNPKVEPIKLMVNVSRTCSKFTEIIWLSGLFKNYLVLAYNMSSLTVLSDGPIVLVQSPMLKSNSKISIAPS